MVRTLWDWVSSIVIALAIALFVNAFVFQRMVVAGPSMEPTLYEGESLFVEKLTHSLAKTPAYGDIVVIDSRIHRMRNISDDLVEPVQKLLKQADYFYVKRVIGRPGDTIAVKDGAVFRNGQRLHEQYLNGPMHFEPDKTVTVPPGHIFVMGDNRNNSLDSRRLGSIPLNHCLGSVFGRI
ncbi:MAG: signal peptidase I [Negativicutes bacterium]